MNRLRCTVSTRRPLITRVVAAPCGTPTPHCVWYTFSRRTLRAASTRRDVSVSFAASHTCHSHNMRPTLISRMSMCRRCELDACGFAKVPNRICGFHVNCHHTEDLWSNSVCPVALQKDRHNSNKRLLRLLRHHCHAVCTSAPGPGAHVHELSLGVCPVAPTMMPKAPRSSLQILCGNHRRFSNNRFTWLSRTTLPPHPMRCSFSTFPQALQPTVVHLVETVFACLHDLVLI